MRKRFSKTLYNRSFYKRKRFLSKKDKKFKRLCKNRAISSSLEQKRVLELRNNSVEFDYIYKDGKCFRKRKPLD